MILSIDFLQTGSHGSSASFLGREPIKSIRYLSANGFLPRIELLCITSAKCIPLFFFLPL